MLFVVIAFLRLREVPRAGLMHGVISGVGGNIKCKHMFFTDWNSIIVVDLIHSYILDSPFSFVTTSLCGYPSATFP